MTSQQWQSFLDTFGVLGGAASLYGAWLSWRQSRAARLQSEEASRQNREATLTRVVVAAAEDRVRRLIQRQTAAQVTAELIANLRLAEAQLVVNSLSQVGTIRHSLNLADRQLSRLAVDPHCEGLRPPAEWDNMRKQIAGMSAALLKTSLPMSDTAVKRSSVALLGLVSALEQVSVSLSAHTGATDASAE